MIDVGQLKKYDYVEIGGKIGQVKSIDYYREVADEHEEITVDWGNWSTTDYIVPNKEIKKIEPLTLKVGDRVRCINDWTFADDVEVGFYGTVKQVNGNEVIVKFDDLTVFQQTSRPTLYLGKVNLGEEEMIKVGDIVTVKCGNDTKNNYGVNSNMETMERENKGYEVKDIRNGGVLVEVKDGYTTWNFHINDVKLFNKGEEKMKYNQQTVKKGNVFNGKSYSVIFNGPATVLFVDEIYSRKKEKFVTKAYNEVLDEEKGLALALLKSFGMSYLDFKRILATSKKEEKEVKENKNQVKVKKEVIKNEIVVDSPKGKKKGKPFTFFVGDKVIVRNCDYYTHTTNANGRKNLNKVCTIEKDNSDYTGTCYVVNGVEYSGSELQPYKE